MSNFKNAVRIQEMVEENADLKMQIKTLKDCKNVDSKRITNDRATISEMSKSILYLEGEILKLEGENEALLEELDILKSYFRLKL